MIQSMGECDRGARYFYIFVAILETIQVISQVISSEQIIHSQLQFPSLLLSVPPSGARRDSGFSPLARDHGSTVVNLTTKCSRVVRSLFLRVAVRQPPTQDSGTQQYRGVQPQQVVQSPHLAIWRARRVYATTRRRFFSRAKRAHTGGCLKRGRGWGREAQSLP
jgi:hypothetical protein